MKELKVSVQDPYIDVIYNFLKAILSFDKLRPSSLVLPKFQCTWDTRVSTVRFTDNPSDAENDDVVHLEVENFSETKTEFQGIKNYVEHTIPHMEKINNPMWMAATEVETAWANQWYAASPGESDYFEVTLLLGHRYGKKKKLKFRNSSRLRVGFSIALSLEPSEDYLTPNHDLRSDVYRKGVLVNHNGSVYGPEATCSSWKRKTFDAPLVQGDVVGLLFTDERLVVVVNGVPKCETILDLAIDNFSKYLHSSYDRQEEGMV